MQVEAVFNTLLDELLTHGDENVDDDDDDDELVDAPEDPAHGVGELSGQTVEIKVRGLD